MSAASQIDWTKYETPEAGAAPPQIDFSKYEGAPSAEPKQAFVPPEASLPKATGVGPGPGPLTRIWNQIKGGLASAQQGGGLARQPTVIGNAAQMGGMIASELTQLGIGPDIAPGAYASEMALATKAREEAAKLGKPTSAWGSMAQYFEKKMGIIDPSPTGLMTKAVKPGKSNVGWEKAIASAMPDMKAMEDALGKPIASVEDALHAASLAKKTVWAQYQPILKTASEAGATIDGNQIADAMLHSVDARTAIQNPGLVERIGKVADTYRRAMPVDEAEDFLESANNDLHSYYAKNKVGQQVAMRDPETGHVVAEADALRKALYSKLDEVAGPGAANLKQRYGALSNVQNELQGRLNVAARQQPQSLAEQLTYARALGKIAVGTMRGSPAQVLEGTESLAVGKFLKERGTADAMITRAFQNFGAKAPAAGPTINPGRIVRPLANYGDDVASLWSRIFGGAPQQEQK